MPSRRTTLRLAVPLAAAGVVAAIAAPGGHAQAPTSTTLSLVEKNAGGSSAFIDNTPHSRGDRPAAGDQVVFSLPLYDGGGTKRIGTVSATCIVWRKPTSEEPPLICHGFYALPDGDLIVAGRLAAGPTKHLAVVGGTGAYAGARGTLDSTDTSTGSNDTLTLLR
jgi:hypothetical protein